MITRRNPNFCFGMETSRGLLIVGARTDDPHHEFFDNLLNPRFPHMPRAPKVAKYFEQRVEKRLRIRKKRPSDARRARSDRAATRKRHPADRIRRAAATPPGIRTVHVGERVNPSKTTCCATTPVGVRGRRSAVSFAEPRFSRRKRENRKNAECKQPPYDFNPFRSISSTLFNRRTCRASSLNFAPRNARASSTASSSPTMRAPRHRTFMASCSTP